MEDGIFEFCTTIDGTEYVVVVKSYTPGTQGYTWGRPEDCYPPESPEADFDLIDQVTGQLDAGAANEHYHYIVELIGEELSMWADESEGANQ